MGVLQAAVTGKGKGFSGALSFVPRLPRSTRCGSQSRSSTCLLENLSPAAGDAQTRSARQPRMSDNTPDSVPRGQARLQVTGRPLSSKVSLLRNSHGLFSRATYSA